jgi:hypothetical protein
VSEVRWQRSEDRKYEAGKPEAQKIGKSFDFYPMPDALLLPSFLFPPSAFTLPNSLDLPPFTFFL